MNIEITSVSTKGQVVIPSRIRRKLGIREGSHLMVTTDGENVLMKAIEPPRAEAFSQLVRESRQAAREAGLTPDDVDQAIQESRRARGS